MVVESVSSLSNRTWRYPLGNRSYVKMSVSGSQKVVMSQLQAKVPTDTWVNATWDEYIKAIGDPAYERARSYYYNGRMRLEMSALGNPHSRDHFIVIAAIALFAALLNHNMNYAIATT